MKKFLFIILVIIFIFNINILFCQDNTGDVSYNKAVEFSIGGGVTHSIYLNYWYSEKPDFEHPFRYGQSIALIIPISFIYYPLNKYGTGFSYILGIDIILSGFYENNYGALKIHNKLKHANKIGNLIVKKWLLIEYGISLSCSFSIIGVILGYPAKFNFGPDFFIGYERIKNKFSYTIGGVFNILYSYHPPHKYYGIEYSAVHDLTYYFGVEFRWRFAYFKPLKIK